MTCARQKTAWRSTAGLCWVWLKVGSWPRHSPLMPQIPFDSLGLELLILSLKQARTNPLTWLRQWTYSSATNMNAGFKLNIYPKAKFLLTWDQSWISILFTFGFIIPCNNTLSCCIPFSLFFAPNAGFQWPPCKVLAFTKDSPGIWIFDPIEGQLAVHCKPLLCFYFSPCSKRYCYCNWY